MDVDSLLKFRKYHGLGNDFLVIDIRLSCPTPSPEIRDSSGFYIAQACCDRRLGVGGDGLLLIGPPTTPTAVASMRVLNADGSEAEMCGNGLRCVARHLFEEEFPQQSEIVLDTGAGPLLCTAHWSGKHAQSISVQMGRPLLSRRHIPMLGQPEAQCIVQPYQFDGRDLAITAVSMGNPHAVAFVPEKGDALMRLAEQFGPQLEVHKDFPQRCNAEFAHIGSPDFIELVVWERGCGITQACGTGACATVVAAALAGLVERDTAVSVQLPGGVLQIQVAGDVSQVTMTGPAVHVFDGTIDLSDYA